MSDRKPADLPLGPASDEERKRAVDWFEELRDSICAAFE